MSYKIHLDRASKFRGQIGHGYEVVDRLGTVIAQGWSAGNALTVRDDAKAHSTRVLQQQERSRLAAITGDEP